MAASVPLIYNPTSGSGRCVDRAHEAREMLEDRGWDIELVATRRPGDAADLAEKFAAEGRGCILVMGGDGTISEAADGVLRNGARPELGFLPGGTGNDFLRDFNMDPLGVAVEKLGRGNVRPLDAALVEWEGGSRHFINVFGTGMLASVTDRANRRLKWMGSRAYTAAALPELARLRPLPTRLTLDGQVIEDEFLLVSVCNNIHAGGNMKLAPMAQIDDGWLDVVALRAASRASVLRLLLRVFDGTHMQDPRVVHYRAKEIRIEHEGHSKLVGDGEVYGQTPCTIRILPGALRLLC